MPQQVPDLFDAAALSSILNYKTNARASYGSVGEYPEYALSRYLLDNEADDAVSRYAKGAQRTFDEQLDLNDILNQIEYEKLAEDRRKTNVGAAQNVNTNQHIISAPLSEATGVEMTPDAHRYSAILQSALSTGIENRDKQSQIDKRGVDLAKVLSDMSVQESNAGSVDSPATLADYADINRGLVLDPEKSKDMLVARERSRGEIEAAKQTQRVTDNTNVITMQGPNGETVEVSPIDTKRQRELKAQGYSVVDYSKRQSMNESSLEQRGPAVGEDDAITVRQNEIKNNPEGVLKSNNTPYVPGSAKAVVETVNGQPMNLIEYVDPSTGQKAYVGYAP